MLVYGTIVACYLDTCCTETRAISARGCRCVTPPSHVRDVEGCMKRRYLGQQKACGPIDVAMHRACPCALRWDSSTSIVTYRHSESRMPNVYTIWKTRCFRSAVLQPGRVLSQSTALGNGIPIFQASNAQIDLYYGHDPVDVALSTKSCRPLERAVRKLYNRSSYAAIYPLTPAPPGSAKTTCNIGV